ncbi:beta-ketoacyl-ACP reductase [Fundicoccus culcitae]|uniref:Beta-ketoacyl-ACP reductase n=1 Tax=Fundicoccus culcitae TaxID=2969821 RepID=A0ABY5P8Q1_9LACT|nr:beta-ketoacyl-ACP reductase [Fundicoccus culcitae]UUX34975.1 beta-ketoacyl-ACP reductase [Fundicoccus culcitae]
MDRLKDKVALITGGSQGLGAEMAKRFKEEGAKVVSLDLKAPTEADVDFFELNVTDSEKVNAVIAEVFEKYGKIDILVNNAGITADALLNKMTDDQWDRVINVNLKGVFNVTRAVSPHMIEQGTGSVINISSVVGEYGNIGQSNYAATKAGVIGLTYTWAKEFTRKGAQVRTNCIAPGYINTSILDTVPEKIIQSMKDTNPMKRLGEPIEIANAALFLASDEASYVNGQVLGVNGGMRL